MSFLFLGLFSHFKTRVGKRLVDKNVNQTSGQYWLKPSFTGQLKNPLIIRWQESV